MQYVPEGSTFQRVLTANSSSVSLALPQIKAPRNGYCYVYLSNESNEHVYFDGFQVQHTRGRIIEEDHYYAYGLKIAALSSRKTGEVLEGKLDNQHLFQADNSEFDEETLLYDFALRNYDAQIGRWVQQDPYSQHSSPYTGMGNDPVNRTDPDGGFDWFRNSKGEIINLVGNHDATACIDGIEYTNIGSSLDVFATRTVLGTSFQQKIGTRISTDDGPVGGIWHPVDNIDFLMSSPNIPQTIAKSDGLGTTFVGKEKWVEAKVFTVRDEVIGKSIRSGIGGAVGYSLGGDRGAIAGSYFDQAAIAFAALPKPNFTTRAYDRLPRAYDDATGAGEKLDGSFSITDLGWRSYPEGGIKPTGPFRLLEGAEYDAARNLANRTNAAIHAANPQLKGLQIHEVQPVKFGGSPTNMSNKISLTPSQHARYTNFWNALM